MKLVSKELDQINLKSILGQILDVLISNRGVIDEKKGFKADYLKISTYICCSKGTNHFPCRILLFAGNKYAFPTTGNK